MVRPVSQSPRKIKDLPKKQREFLKHYVRSGEALESYAKAGYKATHRSSLARTSKLLRSLSPYLTIALTEYVEGTEMGVLGVKVIRELALGADSEQVRLQAAKEMKQMAIKDEPVDQTIVHVHKQLTNEDLDKRLLELQEELWSKAPKLEVVS